MRRLIVVGMLLLVAGLAACTGEGTDDVRTVDVTMTDDLRYDPDELRVSAGETVRFVIRNAGADVHEFLVGTAEEQAVFAQEMADEHGGGHADDAGVSVDPAETAEFSYTFDVLDDVLIGCHQPGHYDGGMVGRVSVES
ncbi:MAG: cupredoxin domain-containing protein [Candidatus Limnocylindria bacterium]